MKEKLTKSKKQKVNLTFCFTATQTSFAGFTLPEVLITLGIIGIVAALLIPTVFSLVQDYQFKQAYRKAYSVLSQAFYKALSNNEIVPLTGTYSSQGGESNFAVIEQYFSVAKDCDASNLSKCWNTSGDHWRSDSYSVPAFVDNSGMVWKLRYPDSSNLAPAILVDTNGTKGPNKYGQDRFPFIFGNQSAHPSSGSWGWSVSDMGMPAKILPFYDLTANDAYDDCPSADSHPCYFTTWLLGD